MSIDFREVSPEVTPTTLSVSAAAGSMCEVSASNEGQLYVWT